MSAATITPPADVITSRAAREVFARATGPGCEWPAAEMSRRAIAAAVTDLGEALEFYQDILAEELHPTSAYEDLLHFQPEGQRFAEALRLAAEEAMEAATEVIRVIGEHCGTKAAAYVSCGEEGQWAA